ncbi:hypothetical protein [Bacillus sp. X1(2014)]|uniref:hypothetical protein n=1 Tax=Bacillus sp. X1(2014) TaxID=1565991 RepID=UPI0011A84DB1|nr:hypothetical protein [Bacillus sp. X1(2014)]
MNLFTFGKDPVEFITVLIYRDLIIPYLLLLFVNQLSFTKMTSIRILITAVILTLLLVCENLLRILGYSHNHHWSIWQFSLVCIGQMVYSLLIEKMLMKLASRRNRNIMVHLIYDRRFDINEWFVLGMIFGGLGFIYFCLKNYQN